MGTSKSYDGPADHTPLLPRWAQAPEPIPIPPSEPVPTEPPEPTETNSPPEGEPANAETPIDADPLTPSLAPSPAPPPIPIAAPALPAFATPWKSARLAMTAFSKHGGAARARSAGQRYVRARGGSRRAAQAAASGRATTAALGGFLSNVASRGFSDAARTLGLSLLVGQSATSVLNAILNALAPTGASNEEAIARRATAEVLADLFERYGVQEGGTDRLDNMPAADVAAATEKSVAAYIYQRWLLELGKRIDQGAYSDREAVRMEREVKAYVRDLVRIDLRGRDILTIDWNGVDGQQFCQRIFQEAYALLENG